MTSEECNYIEEHPDIVKEVSERKKRIEKYKERVLEKEDKAEVLATKAKKLANVISNAKHLIVYSGAGISTSAKIPDYRGPQGIWTLLQRGEEIGDHDLSLAVPTYTHMALSELHKRKILKHVVSQNCDGLHLRSGLPRFSLSEVHGNMYVEVCKHCKPAVEYWRLFDTTPLTSRFQHKTNRRCRICANPLVDTIVHFGERGSLKWPLNWNGATKAVEKADVVLCLGSSLKVLKKYPWLWALDKPQKQRPRVYIVNLQWTPKDSIASIKINGKCDEVMKLVMKYLNIDVPKYNREKDPIFHHASLLKEEELHTASQPMLKTNNGKDNEEEEEDYNENDESTTSDKITPLSTEESEDSKSQINFKGMLKSEDIKVKLETSGSIETTCENGKIIEIKEEVKEVVDLTADIKEEKIVKNGTHKSGDENIDFEELIDQLEVKKEIKKEEEEEKASSAAEIIKQQNQNLIDMALLNNSLLTASLALAPVGSTSHEALTATALILNYNNQIISSLTNNFNLNLPYSNGTNHHQQQKPSTPPPPQQHQQQSNCDKSNVINKKENYENDIEMVVENGSEDDSMMDIINGNEEEEETSQSSNSMLMVSKEEILNPEQYYKQLFEHYCKAINDNLPKWSDVNYAYSGLHTIVNAPPENAEMWKSDDDENHRVKKLRSSTAAERKAAKAECKFCYERYEEAMECQFYKPINREFKITTYRNGKLIVCECCDYTDDEEDEEEVGGDPNDDENSKLTENENSEKIVIRARAGWFGKGIVFKLYSLIL